MSKQLEIRKITSKAVSVPLKYPVRTASGDIAVAPLLLIDVETDHGIVGRSYLFTYTPLVLKPLKQLLDNLASLLVGTPCAAYDVERLVNARFRLLGNTGLVKMTAAGIDMAIWDANARALGTPLANLLGAAVPSQGLKIPAYFSQGLDGIKGGEALARECIDRGFSLMKIKLGYATLEQDLEVTRAVQKTLGAHAQLAVDYNQSLSVPEALKRCRALDGMNLAWIEEPTLQDDYLGHAKIAQLTHTPIMLGENWFGTDEMHKALSACASDFVMPDLMKIGGVSGWLRASALANTNATPIASHLFHEMSAHLMAVTPNALKLEYLPLADAILESPTQIEDGCVIVNAQPGSGIEWKASAVNSFEIF